MPNEESRIVASPTVLQVIEQFLVAMRADPDIPDEAIARLENLLLKGAVTKPDEINAAVFDPPPEGHT